MRDGCGGGGSDGGGNGNGSNHDDGDDMCTCSINLSNICVLRRWGALRHEGNTLNKLSTLAEFVESSEEKRQKIIFLSFGFVLHLVIGIVIER